MQISPGPSLRLAQGMLFQKRGIKNCLSNFPFQRGIFIAALQRCVIVTVRSRLSNP